MPNLFRHLLDPEAVKQGSSEIVSSELQEINHDRHAELVSASFGS